MLSLVTKKRDHKIEDYEAVNPHKTEDGQPKPGATTDELTANQTIFLSVVTAYILILIYFLWIICTHETYMDLVGYSSFIFKERYDYTFYLALFSGIFCYFSYHFMIQAFESSSSTIILPLLQFPSIIVLVGSAVPKYFLGQPWLESYWHLLAYILIFFGGVLPATEGNLKQLMTKAFWKQPFVKFAIVSELNHSLYNLMISSATSSSGIETPAVENENTAMYLHMEFFAITRILYVTTFLVWLFFSKKLQDDVLKLRFASNKAISYTIISEVLAFIGYFNSALAYQCYYQTGVVSASESSLNQLLNLTFAYAFKKYYDMGKKASMSGVWYKLVSATLIMIGLLLAGGEGE